MLNTDFAPWPSFTQKEADAVARVLLSNKVNYWTGGEGRAFETEFAAFAGTPHAIALANGTVALDLALYGLRIGAHNGGAATDEVIVTPRSFMASASAIVNAGARPVFADVGRDSQNIEPNTIAPVITDKTRAILCVHLAGWPCDMDGIRDVIGPKDIKLIEDCAQAHGALYKTRPVGGLGDVAAWSFCQDKIMTTGGEGGMVTCHDRDLWARMWAFKDHGKSWDAVYNKTHPPGFRWLHESFGTNWRITEMQSAIGRIQLSYMPAWTQARTANATRLQEIFLNLPAARIPKINGNRSRHGWYKFYAFVRPDQLAPGWSRDRIIADITARGVPCMQGACSEMYREKAFDGTGIPPQTPLPVAQELGQTSVMFLVHPSLKAADMDRTCAAIQEVFSQACI